MKAPSLDIPHDDLREFCARHGIRKLALFGSVLREDFAPDSDVDVIVEFKPGEHVGLIRLGTIEAELSDLLGHRADVNMPEMLGRHFRDEVLAGAETIYDAA